MLQAALSQLCRGHGRLVAHLLDFINVLSYDFHGPWDAETNFNSPFRLDPADPTPLVNRPAWNVTGTVDFYLENHVPRRKIVLGVPFYARQYGQVPSANNSLYSRSTTPASTRTSSSGI